MLIALGKVFDQCDFLILLFAHMTRKGWLQMFSYACQININKVLSQKRKFLWNQVDTYNLHIHKSIPTVCM